MIETYGGRKPSYPEIGEVFGYWKFLAPGEGYRWLMRCVCGTEREVRSQDLRQQASTSCGCKANNRSGNAGKKNKTHGTDYGSKLYRTWRNAKNRCFNPNADKFKTYGARGITMCPEWAADFEAFSTYIREAPTPLHTLDRIDNTKGYEPNNVRWATAKEQSKNRATTIFVTYRGESRTIREWSDLSGIKYAALAHRNKEWPREALEEHFLAPSGFRIDHRKKYDNNQ